MPRRSPYPIELAEEDRAILERRAARYTAPYREVVRAKIVLMAAKGYENKYIAASDRKSTRLNSSHIQKSRMPSSA